MRSASELFGPTTRTGFELELSAPEGLNRSALAASLAKGLGGAVRYGFKPIYLTLDRDGRIAPCCELTPCCQVLDEAGQPWATLVDDFSIRAELKSEAAPTEAFPWRLVMDDL